MNGGNAMVMENDKIISVYFDNALDLLEHEENGRNKDRFNDFMRRSKPNFKRNEWYGSTNHNAGDVIDHSLIGDDKLYESLRSKINQMNKNLGVDKINYTQKIKSVRRELIHGKFGDELDIHKVYSGNLDTAWSRRVREEFDQDHHLVTLYIDIGGNSNIKVTDSLWRAVVALKVFEDLERAGKSVKIIAGGASTSSFVRDDRSCAVGVVIKEYNQSLSLQRLAAMSHVGFYRVFGFGAKACQGVRTLVKNLGRSASPSNGIIPINVQEEINKGHTKLIHIDKCCSLYDAKRSLDSIYKQLLENNDA